MAVVAAVCLTAADSDASIRCSIFEFGTPGIQEPGQGGDDGALYFFAQKIFTGLDEEFDEHGRTLGIMVETPRQ